MSPNLVSAAAWKGMRCFVAAAIAAFILLLPSTAHASLLPPEMEDTLADYLAIFVLLVVPIGVIVLFWLVHVMPEKIAHQRHHPQFEAIRTLCLLSLVFGGILWPLAWLWAYTKPVGYKMAYGTDKHPDYYRERGLPVPGDDDVALPPGVEPESH